jgi:hypothetical protein
MVEILKFNYTECRAEELFLNPGTYEFEVWGASGGSHTSDARGLGGYARGTITLGERTKVFVHVGSQGNDTVNGEGTQGCNGGGYAHCGGPRSGGGATDIRLKVDSLYSRVIVAGGGGGTGDGTYDTGGYGGGLNGGNGGIGYVYSNAYAGKGGGQQSETTACADGTLNTCPKGIFGYGGNATSRCYAGAGGGGWFGGSASNYEYGAGGGSGYVLTSSSAKVGGYLLGEEFYLSNTSLLSGAQTFPKPDKSGSETGHLGNGYAIIKPIIVLDPPPANASILNFSFTRGNDFVVKDEYGKFSFNEYGTYTSFVKPGSFLINANGSSCGQSILAEYRSGKYKTMNISIYENIRISVDNEVVLLAPGYGSALNTTISPKLRIFHNYSMSLYQCLGVSHSELSISYHYFNQLLCLTKSNTYSIPISLFSFIIFS